MISIEQINGEIAILEEERPTHVIMQKLAALYIVRDHITFAANRERVAIQTTVPELKSGSDFARRIYGADLVETLNLMDDLMNTLSAINPNLYNSVLRQLP